MKIVLIYPRYRTRLAGGLEEPLGLLYIAATLRRLGHTVAAHDLTFVKDLGALASDLPDADWIGFSSSSPLFGKALEILAYVKAVTPKVPTVIGGPHATIMPDEVLEKGFDYALLGEGEQAVAQFADLFAQGRGHDCPGIASKVDGKIKINPRCDFIADLDSLPFPARDLIDYSHYPTIGMVASRGCPFNCLYCKPMIDHLFGKKVRHRSAANVVAEIEYAIGVAGHKEICFKDDTLTVLPGPWFDEFAAELKRKNLKIRWQANSRVDTITYDKLKLMKATGCMQLGFGVETGSPRTLEFFRKHATIEQVEQAFRWCHELGILPHAYLMLGAPEETVEDLQMTYELVKRIKPRSWIVFTTTAFPGNDLYAYAVEHDILNIKNYDEYDNAENSIMGRMPLKLKHLTASDITRYRNKINHYLLLVNAVNPSVILKALRRPGAAVHGIKNVLFPPK